MQTVRFLRHQNIFDRRARQRGANLQPLRSLARQILRAVDGDINFPVAQRPLDFTGEKALAPSMPIERFVAATAALFVTARRDDLNRNLQSRMCRAQPLLDQSRLRARQVTAARPEHHLCHDWDAGSGASPIARGRRPASDFEPPLRAPRSQAAKSATCSAMISSPAATCCRRNASDWSAMERSESMS